MRASSANAGDAAPQPRSGEQAGAQTVILLLVAFFLGIAASALLFYATSKRGSARATGETSSGPPSIALSESTRAVLARLDTPMGIRFYALLDPATVPASTTAFAGRVGQLLAAYEQQAGGKIKVTTIDEQSNANANAALADGITAFNRDKGDACYLGIALTLNGRNETLPLLSPEWEQALEPDLTRAISRLLEANRSFAAATSGIHVETNAIQEVKALIPDPAAVSLEAGKQILRDAALKDYTAAAKEMQAQVKEAEQRLSQARNGGTAAEQQAAGQHLEQVQAEQARKLKQIAAQTEDQINAFQQLKAAGH